MNQILSFQLFNDFGEFNKVDTINFTLKIKNGEIKRLSGIFNVRGEQHPFTLDQECFRDLRFNFRANTQNLDTYGILSHCFGLKVKEALQLISCYYTFLHVIEDHPFCYDLDLSLPHTLNRANFFNKNMFNYLTSYVEIAYYLPDIPIPLTALSLKVLEAFNFFKPYLYDGPVVGQALPYGTLFKIINRYMNLISINNQKVISGSDQLKFAEINSEFKIPESPKVEIKPQIKEAEAPEIPEPIVEPEPPRNFGENVQVLIGALKNLKTNQ